MQHFAKRVRILPDKWFFLPSMCNHDTSFMCISFSINIDGYLSYAVHQRTPLKYKWMSHVV